MTWNGFAHDRHELTSCGDRARSRRACRRRRRPPHARDGAIRCPRRESRRRPARAISCDRWRPSASAASQRGSHSRSAVPKPNRARAPKGLDRGDCRSSRTLARCTRGDVDAGENERAAGERRGARQLANPGQRRGEKRRADGLAEQREIHDVRRQVLERPVEPRVAEQHRADRERRERSRARAAAVRAPARAPSPRRASSTTKQRAVDERRRTARDRASRAAGVRRRSSTPRSPRRRARARRRAARGRSSRSRRRRQVRIARRRARRPSRRRCPIHCARVGGSRSHTGGEQRDDRRLHVDEHDRRGDGRHDSPTRSTPEVEREHDAGAERRAARPSDRGAATGATMPVTTSAIAMTIEREAEAPDRDRQRMRVRQSHERPGERDADQRQSRGRAMQAWRGSVPRGAIARVNDRRLNYLQWQHADHALQILAADPCGCRRGSR